MSITYWTDKAASGEDPWAHGAASLARRTAQDGLLAEAGGAPVAALIGYPIDAAEPTEDMPAAFIPSQELENLALGAWYIQVLATLPEHRGQGHGLRLLEAASGIAHAAGRPLSLVASDGNADALLLYRRFGFGQKALRPQLGLLD